MKPVEAKIAAIVEFPMPTNKRELRRFLGMSGYYRSFCKNFAAIVSPLTDLQEVCVDSRVHGNIQCCKYLLCTAPVLSAPNLSQQFKLQVDASAVGAGVVLMQEDEVGIDHPVSFFLKEIQQVSAKL